MHETVELSVNNNCNNNSNDNITDLTQSGNPSTVADELFECVWPFCGIGA